jgi:WD40 repeat protein
MQRCFSVLALCFSPDGSKLAVGGYDNKAAVYDTSSWTELAFMQRRFSANALCFSPDGSKLVVGGYDNKAAVYETSSWTEIASMQRRDSVYALCFSPDGSKLVVGGVDKEAAVYDTSSWTELEDELPASVKARDDLKREVSLLASSQTILNERIKALEEMVKKLASHRTEAN